MQTLLSLLTWANTSGPGDSITQWPGHFHWPSLPYRHLFDLCSDRVLPMHRRLIAKPFLRLGIGDVCIFKKKHDTTGDQWVPREETVHCLQEPCEDVGNRKRHTIMRRRIPELRVQEFDHRAGGGLLRA